MTHLYLSISLHIFLNNDWRFEVQEHRTAGVRQTQVYHMGYSDFALRCFCLLLALFGMADALASSGRVPSLCNYAILQTEAASFHVRCSLGICFSVPLMYQFESHATEFISSQWLIFHLLLLRIVTKYNTTSGAARRQSSPCQLCTLQNISIIW